MNDLHFPLSNKAQEAEAALKNYYATRDAEQQPPESPWLDAANERTSYREMALALVLGTITAVLLALFGLYE